VTQDRAADAKHQSDFQQAKDTYYGLLGLLPSATGQEIRQAYRELSKLYHPDTTKLPQAEATVKFHHLNEAYATLSNPQRRSLYDQKIGYSRFTVIQPPPDLHTASSSRAPVPSSAYLDPNDRPLSAGEVFALFILAITFVACLVLAIAIGFTDSDTKLQVLQVLPKHEAVEASSPQDDPQSSLQKTGLPTPPTPAKSVPPQLWVIRKSSTPPSKIQSVPKVTPDLEKPSAETKSVTVSKLQPAPATDTQKATSSSTSTILD
jgi:hypothetical protein